jgi:hypothetical protein
MRETKAREQHFRLLALGCQRTLYAPNKLVTLSKVKDSEYFLGIKYDQVLYRLKMFGQEMIPFDSS